MENGPQSQLMTPMELASRIASAYTLTLLPNPTQYMKLVEEVLVTYDQKVIQKLADSRAGILAKCKYPPSISEIVEMANSINKPRSKNFV